MCAKSSPNVENGRDRYCIAEPFTEGTERKTGSTAGVLGIGKISTGSCTPDWLTHDSHVGRVSNWLTTDSTVLDGDPNVAMGVPLLAGSGDAFARSWLPNAPSNGEKLGWAPFVRHVSAWSALRPMSLCWQLTGRP